MQQKNCFSRISNNKTIQATKKKKKTIAFQPIISTQIGIHRPTDVSLEIEETIEELRHSQAAGKLK